MTDLTPADLSRLCSLLHVHGGRSCFAKREEHDYHALLKSELVASQPLTTTHDIVELTPRGRRVAEQMIAAGRSAANGAG